MEWGLARGSKFFSADFAEERGSRSEHSVGTP